VYVNVAVGVLVGEGVKVGVGVGVGVHVGVEVEVSVEVGVKVSVAVGVYEGVGVKVFVGVGVAVAKNDDINVLARGNTTEKIIAARNSAITRAKPPMNQLPPPNFPDLGGAICPVFNKTKLRSPLSRRASMPKLIRRESLLRAAVFN
jgi:hypothetical protein